jgi:membrane protease YdiL (CAAX protease family)
MPLAKKSLSGSETRVSGSRSNRSLAIAEVTAMLALLLSFIWIWQRAFRGDAYLVVFGYFALGLRSHVRRGESARNLGLTLANFPAAARNAAPAVVVGVLLPLGLGAHLGTWHFPNWATSLAHISWLLIWGTAQQYGLLCFFYRRLLEIFRRPGAAILAAAVIFAMFHVPNLFLMGVTFVAGLVSCVLYRREPNVLVLGIAHAVISFLLFYALPISLTHDLRVGPGYFALALDVREDHPRPLGGSGVGLAAERNGSRALPCLRVGRDGLPAPPVEGDEAAGEGIVENSVRTLALTAGNLVFLQRSSLPRLRRVTSCS